MKEEKKRRDMGGNEKKKEKRRDMGGNKKLKKVVEKERKGEKRKGKKRE